MSNNVNYSISTKLKISELASTISGVKPFEQKLPVSIPSIKGQRETKASTLIKFLESEGSFNWSLWRHPSVARVPEQVARDYQKRSRLEGDTDFANQMDSGFLNDGFWYGRWDGDHRTHLWKNVFPAEMTYTCMVYPVDSVEVANSLFVKIQKFNQRSLTPEDTIINLYYGKDPDAVKTGKNLEHCGLCIKNSDEGIMPSRSPANTPSTRIRLFQDSVSEAGLEETKMAASILIKGLSNLPKWNREVSPTLLYGLALLLKVRPAAMKNGLNSALTSYIVDTIKSTPKQKSLVQHWSSIAGDKHNKEAECIAVGIAVRLRDAVSAGSYGSGLHLVNPLKVQSLREDLGLDD